MKHALAAKVSEYGFGRLYDHQLAKLPPRAQAAILRKNKFPSSDTKIFNIGVLVYDLERWRSGHHTRGIEDILARLQWFGLAQLPMNLYFQNNIDELDWRWNSRITKRANMTRRIIEESHIYHWIGPYKPWYPYPPPRFYHLFRPYDTRGRCGVAFSY